MLTIRCCNTKVGKIVTVEVVVIVVSLSLSLSLSKYFIALLDPLLVALLSQALLEHLW